MKNYRDKKLNNKGFTLVELLIAVAIVAVIVAPILSAITTSMKVNKKSDDLLNETAVAQIFMEGMRNMSLEEIARQFSQTTNPGGTLNFLPTGVGGTEHKEYQNSFVPHNGTFVFNKNASNSYVFAAKGVTHDNKTYDVKVTLDAADYYKDESKGETDDKLNDTMYVDISDYDSDYDGLYVQSANVNPELCNKLAVNCVTANNQKTADDIAQEADRTITVNITSKAVVGNPEPLIEVGVDYELKIPKSYVGVEEEEETDKNLARQKFEAIFKNTEDTNLKPRNIYILYNPNYYSTNGHLRDNIVINNEENIPVTVYLIKQSSVEEYIQSESEAKYRMEIKVIEGTKGAEYATKLRTNLGYNLYDLLKTNTYKQEPLQVQQLVYECAGASAIEDIYTISETITGKSNETVRIFKKKVEVYPSGAYGSDFSGAPLTTLSSE